MDVFISNRWTKFSSVYFPPGLTNDLQLFRRFFLLHKGSFLCGDFNGRHRFFGDPSDNCYGIHILSTVNSLGGTILNPPSPTHFSWRSGSCIDKFINLSDILPTSTVQILPSFSDHFMISLTIPGQPPPDLTEDLFNYDLVDMDKFNKYVELHTKRMVLPIRENLNPLQIDSLVDEYNIIISNATNKFTPKARSHPKSRVILSPATRKLQASCRNLQRKLFRNNHSPWAIESQLINNIQHLKIMIKNSTSYDTAKFLTGKFNNVKNTLEAHKTIKTSLAIKKGNIWADRSFLMIINQTLFVVLVIWPMRLENYLPIIIISVHTCLLMRQILWDGTY